MRASSILVAGVFCGADIEPGTFHHLLPFNYPGLDSQPGDSSETDANASIPADVATPPALTANDTTTRPPACVGPFAEISHGCTVDRVS